MEERKEERKEGRETGCDRILNLVKWKQIKGRKLLYVIENNGKQTERP